MRYVADGVPARSTAVEALVTALDEKQREAYEARIRGETIGGSPVFLDMRGRYDVILVDSPPLGACVDPMILGTLTRNLVLVLRTGTTDRTMAEAKLDALEKRASYAV